jgi:hypothetical protein
VTCTTPCCADGFVKAMDGQKAGESHRRQASLAISAAFAQKQKARRVAGLSAQLS